MTILIIMRGKKDNCCYYDSKLITEEKENHSINATDFV